MKHRFQKLQENKRLYSVGLIVAGCLSLPVMVAVDLISKRWAVKADLAVFHENLNPHITFWIVLAVIVVFLMWAAFLFRAPSRLLAGMGACILAGTIANGYEIWRYDSVTDWIRIPLVGLSYAFYINIADIETAVGILFAVAWLIVHFRRFSFFSKGGAAVTAAIAVLAGSLLPFVPLASARFSPKEALSHCPHQTYSLQTTKQGINGLSNKELISRPLLLSLGHTYIQSMASKVSGQGRYICVLIKTTIPLTRMQRFSLYFALYQPSNIPGSKPADFYLEGLFWRHRLMSVNYDRVFYPWVARTLSADTFEIGIDLWSGAAFINEEGNTSEWVRADKPFEWVVLAPLFTERKLIKGSTEAGTK